MKFNMYAIVVMALLALSSFAAALEFPVDHSFDGGKTWSNAGVIEGDAESLHLILNEASEDLKAQLKAAIKADGFYALRVGGSVSSVRASCLAAPPATLAPELWLSGKQPAGFALTLVSPACRSPAPPSNLDVHPLQGKVAVAVRQTHIGPTLNPIDVDLFAAGGNVHGSGSSGMAGASSGGKRAATNRPLGMVPGSQQAAAAGGSYQGAHGGQDGEQPPPEQTWWKKNWLYIVGGGMVIMNVATAVLKPQPGAAGAAGAAGGAAGAARRG